MASELSIFDRFARAAAHHLGRPIAFAVEGFSIVLWALPGPLFGWSYTWQLIVNTATTIVTFLMVFVIQNTQNRDTEALQLKLDELTPVNTAARGSMMGLEGQSDSEIRELKAEFVEASRSARLAP
jgi:low affinity Fe/Cu permease